MIRGIHAMFFTPNADELRAFIRDKLRFPFNDTGEGWLIFDLKEAGDRVPSRRQILPRNVLIIVTTFVRRSHS